MHSIWQEQMEFPVYPILKRDKKTDILYVGATLKHAIEANFQKEMGRSVMIIEEKSIGDMPELGGMGILKATNMNEFKELCILKNYIIRQHIPCDLEIISETSIQVHPVKLFLFMRTFESCALPTTKLRRMKPCNSLSSSPKRKSSICRSMPPFTMS